MPPEPAVGLLLAGGLSRRMGGGDKSLRPLGDKTLLAHAADRIAPQVAALVLNANGDPGRFSDYALPVLPDVVPDFAGPLAGILTGMEWAAREQPEISWLLSVPTDAPFLPTDLAARLMQAVRAEGAEIAVACSAGRTHPVVALWPVRLAPALRQAMIEEGVRKIDAWTARYRVAYASWPVAPVDPFFNANRQEDLQTAERLLREL